MTTVHHSFNTDDDSFNDDNDKDGRGGPDWSDDYNGDGKVNEDSKVNDNKEECRATLAKILQWFDFHLQRKFVQRVKRRVISSIKLNI